MPKDLAELPNIGPTIESRLNEIGVYIRADLERIGAANAYKRICENYPDQTVPVCYYLYSLQGALMGVHWDRVPENVNSCRPREKTRDVAHVPGDSATKCSGSLECLTPSRVVRDSGSTLDRGGRGPIMSRAEIQSLVDALNARYADRERRQEIRAREGERPRFELYHFFMSMCSYKLRTVLDEKQLAYVSHDIDIFPPDIMNYYPEYVRLRLKGGEAMTDGFVRGYTGRSSTETEGFDPCVVPTLVDHEAGQVLVNSKRMCMYLDAEVEGGTKLLPDEFEDQILRQLDIVDQTPHVAVLYGVHPDDDRRPAFVRRDMVGVHDRKIARLRENRALAGDDPVLISAYEHKIMKETAAKEFVRTEKDMRAAVQEFRDLIDRLEEDLAATGGKWLFGDRFTLADVFWAVSLFRVRWLGLGYIIDSGRGEPRYPRVAAYCDRLLARPSVRRAVIEWPMHPPSEHLPELYPAASQR